MKLGRVALAAIPPVNPKSSRQRVLVGFVFAPFFFYNFYFFHGDIFKIKYGISLFGSISFLFFKLLHWGIKTCSLFLNKEF